MSDDETLQFGIPSGPPSTTHSEAGSHKSAVASTEPEHSEQGSEALGAVLGQTGSDDEVDPEFLAFGAASRRMKQNLEAESESEANPDTVASAGHPPSAVVATATDSTAATDDRDSVREDHESDDERARTTDFPEGSTRSRSRHSSVDRPPTPVGSDASFGLGSSSQGSMNHSPRSGTTNQDKAASEGSADEDGNEESATDFFAKLNFEPFLQEAEQWTEEERKEEDLKSQEVHEALTEASNEEDK